MRSICGSPNYDRIVEGQLLESYASLLDVGERSQHPRYHFGNDRKQYLVTRALVRLVLSRYLPIAPRDWKFTPSSHGRPTIANPGASESGLQFSVSHTRGLIALGISFGTALGVDVEQVHSREVLSDIATNYFAPQEVRALMSIDQAEQPQRFFEYWTFKEA